jgi:hypothetical protein
MSRVDVIDNPVDAALEEPPHDASEPEPRSRSMTCNWWRTGFPRAHHGDRVRPCSLDIEGAGIPYRLHHGA